MLRVCSCNLPSYSVNTVELITIIVPVYNEGGNIETFLRGVEQYISEPYEILVVYDFPEDDTLPAIAALHPPVASVRMVHNTIGKGVLNAYKAGFAASKGDVVVLMAADGADDPRDVPIMVKLVREGADVAAGSRYMRGGSQVGGPFFKQMLSRIAGVSLYYLAGLPTHDATNNFRAYSRRVIEMPIEGTRSFALGIELVCKAHWNGWKIVEVPTTWRDRTVGVARFRLLAWLPDYLHWYLLALRNAWLPRKRRTPRLRQS